LFKRKHLQLKVALIRPFFSAHFASFALSADREKWPGYCPEKQAKQLTDKCFREKIWHTLNGQIAWVSNDMDLSIQG